MRLFGCPATIGLYRFLFKSPMNVVDLVAIIPYYIELPARIAVFNNEARRARWPCSSGPDRAAFACLLLLACVLLAALLHVLLARLLLLLAARTHARPVLRQAGDSIGVPTFLRVARLVRVARILKVRTEV